MHELMNPSVPILSYLFAFPKDALTFLGLFPSLKNVSELNFFSYVLLPGLHPIFLRRFVPTELLKIFNMDGNINLGVGT